MAEDIEVPVKLIPNMEAFKKTIKTSPIISKMAGQSTRSLISKWAGPQYEKPPKTMKAEGKMEGERKDDGLKKTLKLFKFDLFWRWIKGTFTTLLKFVPILGALADVIGTVIGLILTGLILPYLPAIMKGVNKFVIWGMEMFDLLSNQDYSAALDKIVEGVTSIVADLTLWLLQNLPGLVYAGLKMIGGVLGGLWEGGIQFGQELRKTKATQLGITPEEMTPLDALSITPVVEAVPVIGAIKVFLGDKELRTLVKTEINNSKKEFGNSRPQY